MNRKNLIVAVFALVAVFAASAQAAPKKVLSAKDVQTFIDNYEALSADLDALEGKYDDLFTPEEGCDIPTAMAAVRAVKVPDEMRAIVKKHGLGDNGFEKIIVIAYSVSYVQLEKGIVELEGQAAEMPEMAGYLDQYRQQLAAMKSGIHPDDLETVRKRADDLAAILGSEEGDGSEN
ncbi:MAG TPA: hypothetical protein PLU93_00370 [Treponemataceae bacterium]|nr:hypothetical protein [Treponemataceae bacterium]